MKMADEVKIHKHGIVVITTDDPSEPVWEFRIDNLLDSELRDLASLIRTVMENFKPRIEE